MCFKCHPDKIKLTNDEKQNEKIKKEATIKFTEISAAYETLTRNNDEHREENYNNDFVNDFYNHPFFFGGDDMFNNPMFGSFSNPFDLFSQTFGEAFPFSSRQQQYQDPFGMMMNNIFDPFGTMNQSMFQGSFGNGGGMSYSSSSYSSNMGSCGTSKSVSSSTQIINGKRVTKTVTTIVHPDGRREVTTETSGDDNGRRIGNNNTYALEHDSSYQNTRPSYNEPTIASIPKNEKNNNGKRNHIGKFFSTINPFHERSKS